MVRVYLDPRRSRLKVKRLTRSANGECALRSELSVRMFRPETFKLYEMRILKWLYIKFI